MEVCGGKSRLSALATRTVPATADRPDAGKGQRLREALHVSCGAAHEVGGWSGRGESTSEMYRNKLTCRNPSCHRTGGNMPDGSRFLLPETGLIMGLTRLYLLGGVNICEGFIGIPACGGHKPITVNSTRKVSFPGGWGERPCPSRVPVHPELWEHAVLMLAKTACTPAVPPEDITGSSPGSWVQRALQAAQLHCGKASGPGGEGLTPPPCVAKVSFSAGGIALGNVPCALCFRQGAFFFRTSKTQCWV